jgi:hypothetical protein
VDPDRRQFLRASLGAATALGGWGLSAVAAPESDRPVRILKEPVTLAPGDRLENLTLRLAPDFRWSTTFAAIFRPERVRGRAA